METVEEWRLQKALMESLPMAAVTLSVAWVDNDSYRATLQNYGNPVRPITYGKGRSGPQAINALFNEITGKTLQIVEGGTCQKKNWVFTGKGYSPP